jgi:hypothetical protein
MTGRSAGPWRASSRHTVRSHRLTHTGDLMSDLWTSLVPLIIGSALVPIQIVITTLLLRSKAGKATAVAWVAGMTTMRLAQGLVFGLILGSGDGTDSSSEGPGGALSLLLLVIAIVFYVSAAKQILRHPDEDAPPPKWMAMVESVTPGRAYLLGVGLVAVGAKFWVFTLGAIAAIGAAGMSQPASIGTFLLFVALAESLLLAILVVAYAMPDRAGAMLDRIAGLLERYNRVLVITLGLVFGTWFLVKALDGLGIL